MAYVNSFILAGILCFICQLLLMYTKLGVPKILILGFVSGAILAAVGIMEKLISWGGAGMIIMIVDAGEAVFNGTMLALSGDYSLIITFLGIICAVAVLGVTGAIIYLNINDSLTESNTVES